MIVSLSKFDYAFINNRSDLLASIVVLFLLLLLKIIIFGDYYYYFKPGFCRMPVISRNFARARKFGVLCRIKMLIAKKFVPRNSDCREVCTGFFVRKKYIMICTWYNTYRTSELTLLLDKKETSQHTHTQHDDDK